jgi:hypothetical protein
MPGFIASLITTHHGVPPTDEYTPVGADNDLLRTDNPGYWLATTPTAQAPNTIPTAAELNPNLLSNDEDAPYSQTISTPAPRYFSINPTQSGYLILNLRDYPNWDVTGCGEDTMQCEHYPQSQRDDGLINLKLPPGPRDIHITWQRTWDQNLGLLTTALAILVFLCETWLTSRTSRQSP